MHGDFSPQTPVASPATRSQKDTACFAHQFSAGRVAGYAQKDAQGLRSPHVRSAKGAPAARPGHSSVAGNVCATPVGSARRSLGTIGVDQPQTPTIRSRRTSEMMAMGGVSWSSPRLLSGHNSTTVLVPPPIRSESRCSRLSRSPSASPRKTPMGAPATRQSPSQRAVPSQTTRDSLRDQRRKVSSPSLTAGAMTPHTRSNCASRACSPEDRGAAAGRLSETAKTSSGYPPEARKHVAGCPSAAGGAANRCPTHNGIACSRGASLERKVSVQNGIASSRGASLERKVSAQNGLVNSRGASLERKAAAPAPAESRDLAPKHAYNPIAADTPRVVLTAKLAARCLEDLLLAYRTAHSVEDARGAVGGRWGFESPAEMMRCLEELANATYNCAPLAANEATPVGSGPAMH